jgi:hypothetical protein
MRREFEVARQREAAAARAEVDRELDALRRTRETASATSSDLRGRLIDDLGSLAGRETAARHAAAQVSSVITSYLYPVEIPKHP